MQKTAISHMDHLGRKVEIPFPPERIVSLCPSQTETLFALGLGDRVVGRTSFCIHPKEEVKSITVVGGTKTLHAERVLELRPDLVIAEKEENTEAIVAELEKQVPVYVTDVRDWYDGIRMIHDLGIITGTKEKANELASKVGDAFTNIQKFEKPLSAVYVIWNDPVMCVGSDTYIHSVLEQCGFNNLCSRLTGRYPELTHGQLRQLAPEVILLSTEPFPFTRKHVEDFRHHFPASRVFLVEGEMFSWYGSRMLEAPVYLNRLVSAIQTS